MVLKEYLLIPLFEEFIRRSVTGKRLKPDGKKFSPGTIDNYRYILLHLQRFEAAQKEPLRIRSLHKAGKAQLLSEKRYWKRFYNSFVSYLYKQGCFDNYIGNTVKGLKTFFRYLEQDKMIQLQGMYKEFYVLREEVPIIVLLPEQLHFLIHDRGFHDALPESLHHCRDVFVFGCTVALRFSDLIDIRWSDLETVAGATYLVVRSKKTQAVTRIKLPVYCMEILDRCRRLAPRSRQIFRPVSLFWFNKQIRRIAELAGWTEIREKVRSRRGVEQMVASPRTRTAYRFCDLVSSHVMRRTAITTMLMHGVPETVVKKISGHAGNSKSFYRYVHLAQSYVDDSMDRHYRLLMSPVAP